MVEQILRFIPIDAFSEFHHSVLIANARAYPPFTEPMVEMVPRKIEGPCIIAQRVAISEFVFERMLHDLLYGPLTDDDMLNHHDDSGDVHSGDVSEDKEDVSEGAGSTCGLSVRASTPMPNSDSLPSPKPPNSLSLPKPTYSRKKMKSKLRSAFRRRMKRLALMAADKARIKGVCKKRRAQGTKDAIYVDFCMSATANVTKPGWVGRHNINLPSKPLTLTECVQDYGLTHFPWDGMWVSCLLPHLRWLMKFIQQDPPPHR